MRRIHSMPLLEEEHIIQEQQKKIGKFIFSYQIIQKYCIFGILYIKCQIFDINLII